MKVLRGLVTALAVAAFAGAPMAWCATEAMASSTAEMPCCESGRHDCGDALKPAQCCTSTSSGRQVLQASKTERHAVVPIAVPMHPAVGLAPVADARRAARLATPPVDTGPPACVTFAVLLI